MALRDIAHSLEPSLEMNRKVIAAAERCMNDALRHNKAQSAERWQKFQRACATMLTATEAVQIAAMAITDEDY